MYVSVKNVIREELWLYIRQMGEVVDLPWVLIGNTNQPLDHKDKKRRKTDQ